MGFFKTAHEKRGFQVPSSCSADAHEDGGSCLHRTGTLNFSRRPEAGPVRWPARGAL
jgi:hypothetical protein